MLTGIKSKWIILSLLLVVIAFCGWLGHQHLARADNPPIPDLSISVWAPVATPDVVSVGTSSRIDLKATLEGLPDGATPEDVQCCPNWEFFWVKAQYLTAIPTGGFDSFDWTAKKSDGTPVVPDAIPGTDYSQDLGIVTDGGSELWSGAASFHFTPKKAGYWHITVSANVTVQLKSGLYYSAPANQDSPATGLTLTAVQVQIVDAKAFGPRVPDTNPQLISGDVTAPASANFSRVGALADGTSVLVIQVYPEDMNLSVSLTIQHTLPSYLQIPQTAPNVGSLHAYTAPASWDTNPTFGFPSLPAADGDADNTTINLDASNIKCAFYRPPNNFLFGCTRQKAPLQLGVNVGSNTLPPVQLSLWRPSLILAHGILSAPSTWDSFIASHIDSGSILWNARMLTLDCSDINTSGFDDVANRIPAIIQQEILRWNNIGIAATRLDYFGHSGGGIAGMVYAVGPTWGNGGHRLFPILLNPVKPYLRSDNFGVGDFRRIITVGAPLLGSPVADWVCAESRVPGYVTPYDRVQFLLNNVPSFTGNGCCADDGQSTSTVIQSMNSAITVSKTQMSWMPVAGQAAPNHGVQQMVGSSIYQFFSELDAIGPLTGGQLSDLFPDKTDSDCFILGISQVNGHSGATFKTVLVPNVVHVEETGETQVWIAARKALDLAWDTPYDEVDQFTAPPGPYAAGSSQVNTGY